MSLLSAAEVKVGSTIPIKVSIKEDAPDKPFTLEGISGKNVFVRYVLARHFAGALRHWISWGICMGKRPEMRKR